MAGIYLHIPFCKKACHYCNFHFSTSMKLKNDLIDALLKEVSLRRHYLEGESVSTVYFGGGTPSLLEHKDLQRIMEKLQSNFHIEPWAEVTFEANPDDLSPDAVRGWRAAGVNRLSIGVQSFYEEDLRWMNRAHGASQAADAIKTAQDGGIDNLSIDLIYGTPTLSDEQWRNNLSRAFEFNVPHLSCYALTVEPGTALDAMTKKNRQLEVDPEQQARQFLIMTDWLQGQGYEHYEISNFAVAGKRSLHNSSYWKGRPYLGLGPSAHSFNGNSRQWNLSNNARYIAALERGDLAFEIEHLDARQQFNEYLMVSLRTIEGTDLVRVREIFGSERAELLAAGAAKYADRGWLSALDGRIVLTRDGKLFADGIAADLFAP